MNAKLEEELEVSKRDLISSQIKLNVSSESQLQSAVVIEESKDPQEYQPENQSDLQVNLSSDS